MGLQMNLKYINFFEIKHKNQIKKIYSESFPKEERFPFWILEECCQEKNSTLYAIFDNKNFIGMSYIVNCDDAYYLMYLAVVENLRNKKYGSMILKELKDKYKTIILSIEQPLNEITIRRKNFYLRNGFYDTNKIYEDTGICYEVLCTNNDYIITDDNMLKRYINMTNDPNVLNIISNTFNTNIVNLKDKNKLS